MHLSAMQPGDQGRVIKVAAKGSAYRNRLIAMGLLPGTPFEVVRIAPLGDPVEMRVRGYSLSLRKEEADILEVEALK